MQGLTGCCNKAQRQREREKRAGCLAPRFVSRRKKTPMKQYAIMTFFWTRLKSSYVIIYSRCCKAPLLSAAFVSMLARFKTARTATEKPMG